MGGVDDGFTEPPRRRVAVVRGRWHVTYLSPAAPGQDAEIRSGVLVGPLVPDRSGRHLLAAVSADGNRPHTLIRRDRILTIGSPLRQVRQPEPVR